MHRWTFKEHALPSRPKCLCRKQPTGMNCVVYPPLHGGNPQGYHDRIIPALLTTGSTSILQYSPPNLKPPASRPGLVVLALTAVHNGHFIIGCSHIWMLSTKDLDADFQALLEVLHSLNNQLTNFHDHDNQRIHLPENSDSLLPRYIRLCMFEAQSLSNAVTAVLSV